MRSRRAALGVAGLLTVAAGTAAAALFLLIAAGFLQ